MAKVSLRHVFKTYQGDKGEEVTAVRDFTLEIEDRESVVFVGPSGCGKSTTLRMIAGLEEISKGDVTIGERRVNDVPPKDRDIAMVFQNYALYPHMPWNAGLRTHRRCGRSWARTYLFDPVSTGRILSGGRLIDGVSAAVYRMAGGGSPNRRAAGPAAATVEPFCQ